MFAKTILQLNQELRNRRISAVELAQLFLNRIDKFSHLNAFLDVNPEVTLKQAEAADKKLAEGEASPLTGIPIAHKDIFVTKAFKSTAGSKMLENYKSPFNATIVDNLESEGMVSLGKLNCDEFAMGSSNENSYYGPVLNPWDNDFVPGGSSGGSAAAVASKLAPVATATDTGGSIREPAAFCGVTGVKPTYGRASRWGMIAFASSLDQGGIICSSAEEAGLIFNSMLGFDNQDSTSVDRPKENFNRYINRELKGLKIGIPKEFFESFIDNEIGLAIKAAMTDLENAGMNLVEISLPNSHLGIPVYYVVAPAESSSNLSRYDGVRYGYRAKNHGSLTDMIKKTRSEGLGREPKRRIMIGTYVLSQGYYDAYYLKAQQVRQMIINDFKSAFLECDVIAGPVTGGPAFKLGEKSDDPISMYQSDFFTIPASLAGIPAMSIPCGFSSAGLPIGLQLMGNYFEEAKLLGVAHKYQIHTDWHTKIPQDFA